MICSIPLRKMLDLQHQYNNCTTIPHMRMGHTYWGPPSCEELYWCCTRIKSLPLNPSFIFNYFSFLSCYLFIYLLLLLFRHFSLPLPRLFISFGISPWRPRATVDQRRPRSHRCCYPRMWSSPWA
jgi:hypothetical protein